MSAPTRAAIVATEAVVDILRSEPGFAGWWSTLGSMGQAHYRDRLAIAVSSRRWSDETVADRKLAAREALDELAGPERVEVLRHYMGSAKKAIAANERR